MSPTEEQRTKLVVGLGNPGRDYARTRHNVGFRVLDSLRRRWQLEEGRRAFSGRLNDGRPRRGAAEARVLLLEPHTYMNCAGRSVRETATFYRLAIEDVLAVLDDMALPLGRLRMRADGSAGGHNGLADVLTAMGGLNLPRLRIGIGAPPGGMEGRDFVLSEFRDDERETIERAIESAADAVEDWVFHGTPYVMDRYNRKAEGEEPPASG